MAQQTAVSWLLEWKKSNQYFIGNDLLQAVEQARQMEKEQIVNAWRNGDNDSMYEPKELDKQAEQYYNETYGK